MSVAKKGKKVEKEGLERSALEAMSLAKLRKLASEAKIEGRSKMDQPELIAALLGEMTAPEPAKTKVEFAVFPACPACGTEVTEDASECPNCNTAVIVGTCEGCHTDIVCLREPASGDRCPKCNELLIPEGDAGAQGDERPRIYREDDKVVYADPRNGIFAAPLEEALKELGDEYVTKEVWGGELPTCQNPDCSHKIKSYAPKASWFLEQLELAEAGKPWKTITPWHPGHKDCREAILGSDTPCLLGCGNMLHHREAAMAEQGQFVTCAPCKSAAEQLLVTKKSDKSGEEVTLPLWNYLVAEFFGNPVLTHDELTIAKQTGEVNYDKPGELRPEVLEEARNLIKERQANMAWTPVKCRRCGEGRLRKWQADKVAKGDRAVCDRCADELSGEPENVPCGHSGCEHTVKLNKLQQYLIGLENVRCFDHREVEPEVEPEPEEKTEAETEPEKTEPEAETGAPPVETPPQEAPPVTPMVPQVAATGDGAAAIIAGLGQFMGGLGTFAQSLRPATPDIADAIKATAGVARASQEGTKSLGGVAEKQADQLGSALTTSQTQLGSVITQMLRERQMNPRDIAEAMIDHLGSDTVKGAAQMIAQGSGQDGQGGDKPTEAELKIERDQDYKPQPDPTKS